MFHRLFHPIVTALAVLCLFPLGQKAQEQVVFADDDSLEELRQKIADNGYGFTVDHSWVFDLSPAERALLLSRRPLRPGKTDPFAPGVGPLAGILGKTSLPARFDWRDVGGKNYIGSVRNQGGCGSCYAFGASAAAEGVYNLARGLTGTACVDFSEAYIIWCLGRRSEYRDHFFGCDGADYSYSELQALVDVGVPGEQGFPYTPTDPGECLHDADPRVRFAGWYRVPCGDVEAIKTAIMTYGVVDAAVEVSSAFSAYSGGIYQDANTHCSETPCEYTPTNHAVALVGWDDAEGVFFLRNSWGSSWGENGYMRIAYTSAIVSCAVCYLVTEIPSGTIELNRSRLAFGAIGATTVTAGQQVLLSNGGGGTLDWIASTSAPWISVSPTSGSGDSVLTVTVNASGQPFGGSAGTVSVFSAGAANSPEQIQVTLDKRTTGSAPTGTLDTPGANSGRLSGNVAVTGWALDDVEVVAVKVYRKPIAGEPPPPGGLCFIGDAVFVDGARPDIEQANPTVPLSSRSGWGYMMLTNFLPNQGNGTFTLTVVATDREGRTTTLGNRTLVVDNAHATLPFGTIDTPSQGGPATGPGYVNFGWALTPPPAAIRGDGSTIWVWVDGVPLGHPVYNQYRPDIASLFPGYVNAAGAVGYFYLDTTPMSNGTHSIAWSVEDELGRLDGIGSRYFQVLNGVTSQGPPPRSRPEASWLSQPVSPAAQSHEDLSLRVRTGWDFKAPFYIVDRPAAGSFQLELVEGGRLEVHLPEGDRARVGALWQGFQVVNGKRRPLPIGSSFDPQRGIFCWQPGPAFRGNFLFTFRGFDLAGTSEEVVLEVAVAPAKKGRP